MCSIDNVDSLTAQNGGDSVNSIESCINKKQQQQQMPAHTVAALVPSMLISNHQSHQSDHDYEVIKKDDIMKKLHSADISPKVLHQQQQYQQTLVKHNPVVANFNDSITYSLLNTKIAEESEDNDDAHAIHDDHDDNELNNPNKKLELIQQPDLLTNSFAYLKLSSEDKSSQELKSISLRESINNENHLYNMRRSSNNSHSYSANSKSNVCIHFLFPFVLFHFIFTYLFF